MNAVKEAHGKVPSQPLCQALALPRASFYRWQNPAPSLAQPRPAPPRSLSPDERQQVLETLDGDRFADQAPPQVLTTLLDEGTYLCSLRTMYRLLKDNRQVRERRDQLRHPNYSKPELLATAPNQVWSWDITKLRGPVKWTYYYLYVILDIFSRYVVGWMVAERENATLAHRLIDSTCAKQDIQPGQLTIHADRGSSMRSKGVAFLLADLGITKTHSRPYTSTDNPYSEAHFKTLKYCPQFPKRFGSLQDARAFCQAFFRWYNTQHRHSGIAMLTPENIHYGQHLQVLQHRQEVLDAAYAAHPERFVKQPPKTTKPPMSVWINQPLDQQTAPEDLH